MSKSKKFKFDLNRLEWERNSGKSEKEERKSAVRITENEMHTPISRSPSENFSEKIKKVKVK